MATPHKIAAYTFTFLTLAVTATARAQDVPKLERIPTPIIVDGTPDAAWERIAPLPSTMFSPVYQGTPTQRTVIRVAYDDNYLYAAAWMYDTDPGSIRVNSLYRDRASGDDTFSLIVDPFNDNRNARLFGTTPAGVRFDTQISADGDRTNDSWDTFWDAKSRITSDGWFTEMRIPFSSLGFQGEQGRAVMGITATRLISRNNERVTFPAIDTRRKYIQPSVAQDVVMEGVHASKPLYVTPYVLSGMQQEPALRIDGMGYSTKRETSREAGLDMRYALTSELTLDLTTNTDFAQVEADDEVVNLDRFSLFFPEKRRFFQERGEIFDLTTGGNSRIFHSRRIGLVNGVEIPVVAGGRLTGRLSGLDIGMLDMQTAETDISPSENFGVARIKRRAFNAFSSVGGIVASRISSGRHNVAIGTDAIVRAFGDDYIGGEVAQTYDDSDGDSISATDRAHLHLTWQRRVRKGLFYNLNFTRSGRGYNPELGFLPRRNFTQATAATQYFFMPAKESYWSRIYPGIYTSAIYRNTDGTLESGQISTWIEMESKTGGDGWIEPQYYRENVAREFEITDGVTVPVGVYDFANLWLHWSMPTGHRLRSDVDTKVGRYFDGSLAIVTISPTWNLSRHLEVGADYEGDFLRFAKRDQSANVHVARLRVRAAASSSLSANAFVQYNSTSDRLNVNFRARYNIAEGTDLWLVYDEGLATDRLSDPAAPRFPLSASRSLIVKYSHTFHM